MIQNLHFEIGQELAERLTQAIASRPDGITIFRIASSVELDYRVLLKYAECENMPTYNMGKTLEAFCAKVEAGDWDLSVPLPRKDHWGQLMRRFEGVPFSDHFERRGWIKEAAIKMGLTRTHMLDKYLTGNTKIAYHKGVVFERLLVELETQRACFA